METVSENKPKPKRGRPKSLAREHADELGRMGFLPTEARSDRGKIDAAFRMIFLGTFASSPEDFIRVLGCPEGEIVAGTASFPKGWHTAAAEIGRWIDSHADTEDAGAEALQIVIDARERGIPWSKIRMHFRELRIGKREGNALSLFQHLARAHDEYMAKFPGTSRQAAVGGIRNLLEEVEGKARMEDMMDAAK